MRRFSGKGILTLLGGTRDPLVVSWPGKIVDKGSIRTQFSHVTDIAPTIYEITGIKFPESVDGIAQLPLEGKSLVYSLTILKKKRREHCNILKLAAIAASTRTAGGPAALQPACRRRSR